MTPNNAAYNIVLTSTTPPPQKKSYGNETLYKPSFLIQSNTKNYINITGQYNTVQFTI